MSFTIAPGEILGYLGPNGSGKSTTIKIITGLIDASAGHVRLHGVNTDDDPPAFRARIGYVPKSRISTRISRPRSICAWSGVCADCRRRHSNARSPRCSSSSISKPPAAV